MWFVFLFVFFVRIYRPGWTGRAKVGWERMNVFEIMNTLPSILVSVDLHVFMSHFIDYAWPKCTYHCVHMQCLGIVFRHHWILLQSQTSIHFTGILCDGPTQRSARSWCENDTFSKYILPFLVDLITPDQPVQVFETLVIRQKTAVWALLDQRHQIQWLKKAQQAEKKKKKKDISRPRPSTLWRNVCSRSFSII